MLKIFEIKSNQYFYSPSAPLLASEYAYNSRALFPLLPQEVQRVHGSQDKSGAIRSKVDAKSHQKLVSIGGVTV